MLRLRWSRHVVSPARPRFAPATRPGSGRRQGEGRGPRPAGVGAWPRLPLTWLNDNGPGRVVLATNLSARP
jgi:hypothetical protein